MLQKTVNSFSAVRGKIIVTRSNVIVRSVFFLKVPPLLTRLFTGKIPAIEGLRPKIAQSEHHGRYSQDFKTLSKLMRSRLIGQIPTKTLLFRLMFARL